MALIERDEETVRSDEGSGETFAEVVERRLSRRSFLKSAVAGGVAVVGATALGSGSVSAQEAAPQQAMALAFGAITPDTADRTLVAEGHQVQVLLRWGDPLTADAPAFDANNQSAAAQAQQFGYNCDFIGYFPIPLGSQSNEGILVVNHEYTNPELMFPGFNLEAPESWTPTKEQVDIELQAHGLSVVLVRKQGSAWTYDQASPVNRRYTATSPMQISGPAAGHDWLKTAEDPSGTLAYGTLNNCAGGKTPWGTVLSGEENFHQYFANLDALDAADPRTAVHKRYGMPAATSERRWENFYERFDIGKEPNESFRHGWVIEFDPYDPGMMPVKRTALGRFRHEGATFAVGKDGRVAFYTGCDSRFEYIYKFVTNKSWNTTDRAANRDLLDDGVLYVAKLNDDGSGEWLPIIFGQGALTPENGFMDQGDVLVKTRLAADTLGATKMDRPEDIETNPVTGKVYVVLTNNTDRGKEGKEGPTPANPRPANKFGHILEFTEAGDDHSATSFSWDIFLLAGDPQDESTYFAGFPKDQVSIIACPDNITFDRLGNLWISTDGQPGTIKVNDGLYAVPVEGTERGYVRQFFSTPTGAECSGPEFAADFASLFISVQHPGEGGTFEAPIAFWPDGGVSRPSVVVVTKDDGAMIATAPVAAAAPAAPEASIANMAATAVVSFFQRRHSAE